MDDVDVILATIRQLESGGRYGIGPNRARASGAYQYIPSTWNRYAGYAEAHLAPPEVQDRRARSDVIRFLTMYGGDVSMVPVMWYYPRAAVDPSWMDRVPNPAGGNRLTIREYQTRWLKLLQANIDTELGASAPAPPTPAAVAVLSELPERTTTPGTGEGRVTIFDLLPTAPEPEAGPPVELDAITVSVSTVDLARRSLPPQSDLEHGDGSMGSIVFPVLGPVTYADGWGDPRDGGRRRHEGTDLVGVRMQPLLAAVDGVVTRARHESVGISGVVITIADDDGWRYNYFHNNDDTPGTDDGLADDAFRIVPFLDVGDRVVAGQIVGYLGDSGNAEESVAHLHFEMRDPTGRARPSYWSLRAAEARQACTIGIGPWSTPSMVAPLEPLPAQHTVVTPLFGEGQWVVDSTGRVTATGDAALILPGADHECDAGPATPFGTEAAGWGPIRHDVLADTVLADADLTGSVLDGVVPAPPAPDPVLDPVIAALQASLVDAESVAGTSPATPASEGDPLGAPMVFDDPATGETIIVVFDARPDRVGPRVTTLAGPI